MKDTAVLVPAEHIERRIYLIRGHKVMLDSDLAELYGVPTFRFNEAVKRSLGRFPDDFMFQLTADEFSALISQNAMSKPGRGGRRTFPYAFTEHGAIMAANILRSERATQMSIFVVRAFVRMRRMIGDQMEWAAKLAELERKLTMRLDNQESAIVDVLRQLMLLLSSPEEPPAQPQKGRIGFHGE